jgi:hypothetical protein
LRYNAEPEAQIIIKCSETHCALTNTMKYRDLVTLTLISASPVLAHPGLLAQVHLGNIHSPSASSKSAILDKSLNETIARILVEHNVPGYSLVMVRPGADVKVEYGAWGIRNEDGDPMTPEVRLLSLL